MHEKLNKGLRFCLLGNILFIAFGIISYIFYMTYDTHGLHTRILAIIAYITEITGFSLLIFGDWLIISAIRFRRAFKAAWTFYVIFEAVIMLMDLNSTKLYFYHPFSLTLAVIHTIISGLVCLTFVQLDTNNKKMERLVIICIFIIAAGMLGNLLGIRVYFGVICNAIAFIIMFLSIIKMKEHGDIEIDCHGDKARVAEYKSEFIDN
ncbi:hypothetical protein [Ruminococcus sp.]|uniref:hypothetical protein n=1 Tax=Ruminococcus sp. TaxID=41978 RepID=UPI001B4FE079|nr:hypothetical protein [Ruminococcus sp.]MBP5431727.1 hypothetical protein [Ruminococcus sp.]